MIHPEHVHLAREPVDMRWGIERLSCHVQHMLGRTPCDGSAYAFTNRQRSRLKLLVWDATGVWLCQRRLHHCRLQPYTNGTWGITIRLTNGQLGDYPLELRQMSGACIAFVRALASGDNKAIAWLVAAELSCEIIWTNPDNPLCCNITAKTIDKLLGWKAKFDEWYPELLELVVANDDQSESYSSQFAKVSENFDSLQEDAGGAGYLYLIEALNAHCNGLQLPLQARLPDILGALRSFHASGGNLPSKLDAK